MPTTKARKVYKPDFLTLAFAKFLVRHSDERRAMMYSKLQSLLKNHFSLMDALERLYQTASREGKDPTDTFAIAINEWMKFIKNGDSFSVAVQGWVPQTEILTLSVGDIANLELALDNTIKAMDGIKRMRGPVIAAVVYPLFLLLMVSFLVWAVGVFMVPPMIEAAPNLKWTGTAKSLIDLSNFVDKYPHILFSIIPILVITIFLTFPRWTNRLRVYFDRIPPWSIYRIFVGVSWLLSLAALVRAGTPVSKGLQILRIDSTPYLRQRLNATLFHVNNGENLGDALDLSALEFPDIEIIGDLKIYSELDNFSEALTNLSNQWLENSAKMIERKSEILNTIAILGIAFFVAWVVMGTFSMQDQLVNSMGKMNG